VALPFSFCFYDSLYTSFVYGSNGLITFDVANSDCDNAWPITTTIPSAAGTICASATQYYPKASILAAYSDLDPRISAPTASPSDRKIEWRVEGSAPCRKLIVSYYHIGVFGTTCGLTTPNTFQIVLYESTGVVEIFIEQKACVAGTSAGRAILGIQNWIRDKAVAAPGKNNTVWNETNTGYRFVPSGGASRFVSCQVQTLSGTFIANGDTTTTTPGMLDVTFPTLCPTGTTSQYVVKTTFAACDNASNQVVSYDTITVNKTNDLTASAATTQTACGANGSGTATVTVPAGIGTAPYTFVLNPAGTTLTGGSPQQFTGLNAGNYTIIVSDAAAGCRDTIPITITSTGVLSVNYTVTNTTCVGATNGSITVNPPNGTAPITYSINGGPFTTNNVFNGLAPGTYFISTHDAAGCQANFIPVTVDPGASITMTTSTTPTSCPGAANGTITVNSATGVGPYVYSINGGPYQSSSTFTGLIAGTYFISLADSRGCTISFIPVTVNDGPGTVTGTATSTPPSCSGALNGTVTATPTSGTGPYLYSLNGGPYQSSNTFPGLAPGSYTVIIKEAGLCTSAPIPVTIGAGGALLANVTPAATSCNGAADGTITVTPTNGSAPYQYSLDGGPNLGTNTFTGVSAGSHNIIVRDAAGCVSASIPVTVAAGATLTGSATSTATACVGVNNGTITATATNSTGPYTYSLDGGAPQATNVFSGVSAGTHNIVIRNALGCASASIPVTVAAGTTLTATATSTATACVGVNNGSITVTPTNGGAPYQYSLDGGANQSSNVFTGVSAGSHNIVVTDNFGCISAPFSVTVSAGTALTATTTSTSTACAGVNSGSITVTPTNGSAPYQYSLDGGTNQASNLFTGVSAGPHTIIVRDNFGCISAAITVTVATGSTLTGTAASTATTCNGASNGTITATATNGSGPYQYSLDGGPNQPSNLFNGVSSGPHNIVIRDNFGCISAQIPVSVAAGNNLNASAVSSSTSCSGASNGFITITQATNGTAPYLYSLNGGAPQPPGVFNGLAAGSYTIVATDAGGCTSGPIPVTITAGPPINLSLGKTDVTCFSSANGRITATPSTNATAPIQYSLDNTTWQASPDFIGLTAGSYTVYIRDAVGCSNSATIAVGQPSQLTASTSQQSVLCNSGSNGKIFVNVTGGTQPYSYSLDNINFQSTNVFNVPAGAYTIYVKDANGCVIPPINNVNVTEPTLITAASVSSNATCDGGNDGTITITPAGGVSPYQYAITGGSFQSAGYFNVAPGTYDVTIKDVNGCTYPVTGIVVGLTNNLTYTPMVDPAPVCESKSTSLQLTTNANQFSWTNAASLSNSTIANPVATPQATTLYIVTATLGRCTITDDILVSIMPAPIPDAGPQGDICYGKSYQLQGTGGVIYSWTPSTYLNDATIYNPVVTPDKTVTYILSVKDANGCSSLVTDQVTVKVTPPIKVTIYPSDTIVQPGAKIPLHAFSAATDYTWTVASGITGLNNSYIADPVAIAPAEGDVVVYKVTATTSAGCQGDAYARIQVYKGPDIYMVTAFSPNGDGKNDVFIPFPVGIKQIKYFRVINRWGQLIYSTTELNKGWDGKIGNTEQPNGVYVWLVEGVTMDNKIITKKGTVTLVR
jgi:gliding motility-associated-like protein